MFSTIDSSWQKILSGEFKKSYFLQLEKEVNELVALIHHKLTFVNGKLNLNEDYHYVNLNDCVSVKQSDIRGVVFWGYTLKEANDMIEKIGITNSPQLEFKNTGMYLLKKK